MKSLWNDAEAAKCSDDLELRVYSSQLLGMDKSLVLHGGGNTSVKIEQKNILGETETLLYIKGSGWDLETIQRAGFAPVRLDHLVKLAALPALSDPQMVNELKTHMTDAAAPAPSIETILHAILPYKFVDHTHADTIVTITNTPNGLKHIREIFGDELVIVPYVMPGFDLARVCAEEFRKQGSDKTTGMVLMNHGLFSFADTAKESYQRMIKLVTRAEDFLQEKNAWQLEIKKTRTKSGTDNNRSMNGLARLRFDVSQAAGLPMILQTQQDENTLAFANRKDCSVISQQGPATPDHVIRTKQLPMIGRDIDNYVSAYKKYFKQHSKNSKVPMTMLDPAPRIILDPELGLSTAGRSAKDAMINNELYLHTMDIIQRATKLESFQALPSQDIFEVEYWDLEQAKLRKGGKPPVFTGEVALVTGAASGIGKACVEALLTKGAAVVGIDLNTDVVTMHDRVDYRGFVCDVTDEKSLAAVLAEITLAYGGLDMLILNAGIFPGGANIAEMDMIEWRKVLEVNLISGLQLMHLAYPLLKLAPNKGRVVIIGSKNVAAPGPGAGAYSASKAALNQLMRIAALEWGVDGIRINSLHPDAVFDTGIWTPEVIAARAASYGMTIDEYKQRNVMKVEITSADVAALAAEMCGPLFAKTTAAQLPIDGGDVRVI